MNDHEEMVAAIKLIVAKVHACETGYPEMSCAYWSDRAEAWDHICAVLGVEHVKFDHMLPVQEPPA